MKKYEEFYNEMEKMQVQVEELIFDYIKEKGGSFKFTDLYLGEYKPELSGYPEVEQIDIVDDKIIITTNDENLESIDNYNLPELLAILKRVEV